MSSVPEANEIVSALRGGLVPGRGLHHLATGLDRLSETVEQEFAYVAEGRGLSKWIRGEYGSGKTFATRYLCALARRRRFATAEVQVSVNDTPLHHLETVYRRLIERLQTDADGPNAFQAIVEGWLYQVGEEVTRLRGITEDDPAFADATEQRLEDKLAELSRRNPAYAAVLRAYHRASIARLGRGKKSLVFVESRSKAERVAHALEGSGVEVFIHHSSVSRADRALAEAQFASGRNTAIVCTSTMELGIDVGDLDQVIQIDAPGSVASFLQRLGRTGRRPGTRPNCTFFCLSPESLLQSLALLRLAEQGWVESVRPPTLAMHVLAHQIMALTIQEGGLSRHRVFDWVEAAYPFGGLREDRLWQLIDTMLERDILYEADGQLSLGARGERLYGRPQHGAGPGQQVPALSAGRRGGSVARGAAARPGRDDALFGQRRGARAPLGG